MTQPDLDPSSKQTSSLNQAYVSPGMRPMESKGKVVSFFEFWPTWLMYSPVVLQWIGQSIYHRSLTLPLIANPELMLSGMVGVPKSELLEQATGECEKAILPWFIHTLTDDSVVSQTQSILQQMQDKGYDFPIVCKPDIGCRGSGVKLVKNEQQLNRYIEAYPVGYSVMLQRLARHEPEAGLFFVKEPNQKEGKIVSLALKYMPYVVGDGKSTLEQLIAADERAQQLQHLYLNRHKEQLQEIIPEGEPYRLVFSASHCRGAIFKDAEDLITPELSHRINTIMADLPEFYYGRMDIKFPDIESLKAGEGLEIVEINAASSESLHIWDSNTKLNAAVSSLLYQYRTLFKLGQQNRKRGYKTPGLKMLLKHWQKERNLKQFYPETD